MIRAASVLLLAGQLFGGGEENTREGAEHFAAGRLEEALRAFSRAEGAYPEAPENDLNIAGVHYRLGEAASSPVSGEDGPFAEAVRGYQAALEGGADGEVRRDTLYNLGNTLYRAGAFREAAAAYGEAIALDPEDREARQNLERALRAAEDAEQEGGQEGDPQGDQQGDQQGGEQGGEQGQDDQRNQEPPEPNQGQQAPGDQGEGRENPSPAGDPNQEPGEEQRSPRQDPPRQDPPRPDPPDSRDPPPADDPSGESPPDAAPGADAPDSGPGEVPDISPEQAERILAALADVEREFQEARLEERRARALRRGRH